MKDPRHPGTARLGAHLDRMKTNRAVLALVGLSLNAAPDVQAVEVRAVPSCGQWIESRSALRDAYNPNEVWLVGFLSGIALNSSKDFLSGTDTPSLSAWVDKYCGSNPLDYVSKAGLQLSQELIARKRL